MSPQQACLPELERAGIEPESVRWIIQTHLHNDHTGAVAAIASFPNAQVLATRDEWQFAHAPHRIMRAGYIDADFRGHRVDWVLLDSNDDGYDLYGDGVVRLWRTPGHTPGHQSVEVTLPRSGSLLLTADACYTMSQWEGRALAAVATSLLDHVHSLEKLHRLANRAQATVILGHDQESWQLLPKAPEYYD